jgi:hypothetical protein
MRNGRYPRGLLKCQADYMPRLVGLRKLNAETRQEQDSQEAQGRFDQRSAMLVTNL